MKTLLIETSGTQGGVALADGGTVVQIRRLSTARKHARDLVPQIREMFCEQGWRPGETELLVADLGPGSYTGLRVGVATAKSIAYATGAKVVGVDTMSVLAEAAPDSASIVDAVVDAQQGLVYHSRFERTPTGLVRLTQTEIVAAEDWARSVPRSAYVTGPALDRYESLVPVGTTVANAAARQPDVERLLSLAVTRLSREEFDDPWALEPLYLRASSAEIKWDARLEASDKA